MTGQLIAAAWIFLALFGARISDRNQARQGAEQ